MSLTPAEQAVHQLMAEKNVDYQPGDRMPWRRWERAVYKPSWRLCAAGLAISLIGGQAGLWNQSWYLPVTMVLINFFWLALIAWMPAFSRFLRVSTIINPPSPRRKHVCVDNCRDHRH